MLNKLVDSSPVLLLSFCVRINRMFACIYTFHSDVKGKCAPHSTQWINASEAILTHSVRVFYGANFTHTYRHKRHEVIKCLSRFVCCQFPQWLTQSTKSMEKPFWESQRPRRRRRRRLCFDNAESMPIDSSNPEIWLDPIWNSVKDFRKEEKKKIFSAGRMYIWHWNEWFCQHELSIKYSNGFSFRRAQHTTYRHITIEKGRKSVSNLLQIDVKRIEGK